jgi:dimethylargininase
MRLSSPRRAWVRAPSLRYASCLRREPVPIDVATAVQQHEGYVRALREAGVTIEWLPPLPLAADAVFVEDTAIVLHDRALITIPGAPSRRIETTSVAQALARHVAIETMAPPAMLDGGDVLRCGDALVVGLSARTNRAGLETLAHFAHRAGLRAVGIEVREGLHLKSACTLADGETLLVSPGAFDLAELGTLTVEPLLVPEPHGANVLALGERVLVSDAAPRTAELLARRGLSPRLLPLSQIHAGDGALTCMSLRLPADADVIA